jgi:predicted permease
MQEIRHALSAFRRNPMFTATAVMTLAVAIGATTAVYSLVYGVLLRPLSFVEPASLVRLWEEHPGANTIAGNRWLSHRTYHSWISRRRTVEAIGGYSNTTRVVRIDGESFAVRSVAMTPTLVAMMGAAPSMGRWFDESETTAGSDRVVVLSHRMWSERFGRRADVIGTPVQIDEQPYVVIGVAPPQLLFPDREVECWLPYAVPTIEAEPVRTMGFNAIARLAPGVTPEQVEAEGTAAARATVRPPSSDVIFGKGGPVVVHARGLADDIAAPVRPALSALAVAVGLVLLVACTNVTNLLLSRGVARQREFAIRVALGAGSGRLARQVLIESSTLAVAGGILGIGLGWTLVRALPAFAPERFPRLDDVALDGHVLLVSVIVTIGTALVSGLLPALRAARRAVASSVRGAGDSSAAEGFRTRASARLRDGLLALEAAFAVILLVGALLLGQSLARLLRVDAGYTPDAVVSAVVRMRGESTPERTATLLDSLAARLGNRPDVAGFGAATTIPMVGMTMVATFPIAPAADSDTTVAARTIMITVTPGYADAIGLRLRRGRWFTTDDQRPGIRPLVVNEEFARRYLRGEVIGRRFEHIFANEKPVPTEIVGVVTNVLKDGNDRAPEPEIYMVDRGPTQQIQTYFSIAIRTRGDASDVIRSLRGTVVGIDSDAVVERVDRLADRVAASMAQPRFAATVVGLFAGLGVTLAALGLFAVLSYGVNQRRRELSVRAALGASPGRLLRLVMGHGLAVTGAGIMVGLALSSMLTRFLGALLFQVGARDVISFIAAPAILLPIAALASLIPALRASTTDPASVLRGD